MKRKYALVTAECEPNIAVLNIGSFSPKVDLNYKFDVIGAKLKLALQEHFDTDVEINSFDVKSVTPVNVEYKVTFADDGTGAYREEVITLSETWIY